VPTYEYICPKCGHEFDLFQSMSEPPIKRCPRCKKLGVKRLVGAGAGLIFKGSGFYITDYKKTSAPKEGGEGKSGGGDTKTDGGAKPADAPKASGDAASSADSKPASKEKPKTDKKG